MIPWDPHWGPGERGHISRSLIQFHWKIFANAWRVCVWEGVCAMEHLLSLEGRLGCQSLLPAFCEPLTRELPGIFLSPPTTLLQQFWGHKCKLECPAFLWVPDLNSSLQTHGTLSPLNHLHGPKHLTSRMCYEQQSDLGPFREQSIWGITVGPNSPVFLSHASNKYLFKV